MIKLVAGELLPKISNSTLCIFLSFHLSPCFHKVPMCPFSCKSGYHSSCHVPAVLLNYTLNHMNPTVAVWVLGSSLLLASVRYHLGLACSMIEHFEFRNLPKSGCFCQGNIIHIKKVLQLFS